ncbi:hypothetical protein OG711_18120 [Streptomyces uncialis]|uniref:hypothetical protein n=1 Tax=Streptomyces uncialis TaxID=1048205 RepID=UPI002E31ABBB|nr:hypothetical protein [Streptomyces uncialis]
MTGSLIVVVTPVGVPAGGDPVTVTVSVLMASVAAMAVASVAASVVAPAMPPVIASGHGHGRGRFGSAGGGATAGRTVPVSSGGMPIRACSPTSRDRTASARATSGSTPPHDPNVDNSTRIP